MKWWRAAVRLAWRDLRLTQVRTVFLLATMAVSVACIGGVRCAADVARSALHRDSRSWLGGDLAVTTGDPLDDGQIEALNQLKPRGIVWTVVTTALTMGASRESPDASVMAVKAVDPAHYPLYGALTIEPKQPLSSALRPDTAVVSEDVLSRFHVYPGNEISIGGTQFRISGVIERETGRFSGAMALGLHCLLSQEGFARSGIAGSGNSPRQHILLRLPPGEGLAAMRERLGEWFPDAELTEYRDVNTNGVWIAETTALCVSLTAFVALTLGAIGMATSARQHIEERSETLAVMKMIGGRNRQLSSIFFLQIAGLAAIGLLAGLPLGWAVRASVLSVAAKYVELPPASLWDSAALRDTAAVGLVALLPTLAGTALAIGRLKPAILLRKDFEPKPIPEPRAMMGLAWLGACAVLGAIAAPLLGSWRVAAILIGSVTGCVALAYLLARAFTAGVRRWMRGSGLRNRPLLRHALANLCWPGNRGRGLIVALAIGSMGLIATFQINQSVAQAILDTLPFDHPDLMVPGIEAGILPSVRAFVESQPGVERVQTSAVAKARLVTPEGLRIAGRVGCAALRPTRSADGLASATVAQDLASRFRLRPGSRVELDAGGRAIPAVVAEVRRMPLIEELWSGVRMNCEGVDPSSLFYRLAAQIRPGRAAAVRRAFIAQFPAVPVGTVEDLPEIIGGVIHDALFLARLVDWYTLGSSLAVLIAIVAASRGARLRDMAVLSALGARRRAVIQLYTVEFAAMGILAGSIGCVLGCGFTAVMVSAVLRGVHWTVEWKSLAAAIFVVAGLSIGAGWLPLYGLLRRKPLEVLRSE